MRRLVLIGILATASVLAVAADKPSVETVIRLYQDLELEKALDMADSLLKAKLSPKDLATVLIYRGLILANVGTEDAMFKAFVEALKADPEAKLPLGQAPQTQEAFARAQSEVGVAPALPPPPPPPPEPQVPPPEPAALLGTATAGEGQVKVLVEAKGSATVRATKVVVRAREPGDAEFREHEAGRTGPSTFAAEISAPSGTERLDVFAEGTRDGLPAGRWPEGAGTIRVEVAKHTPADPEQTSKLPIYLGIGGGVVLVAAIVVVIALAAGSGPSCPSTGGSGCLRVDIK